MPKWYKLKRYLGVLCSCACLINILSYGVLYKETVIYVFDHNIFAKSTRAKVLLHEDNNWKCNFVIII